MHTNFILPSVTEALPILLNAIQENGVEVGSRAGRTQELTHVGITLVDPMDREILCDYRKPNLAAQIAETMWVLAGRDDIDWLANYLPRVRDFSDDGETWRAGYGKRLRAWEDHAHARTIDQWRWVVEHLRENPGSRRAVMSIWDPEVDTQDGKDIPCNDWLSFLSRDGYLDLHVAIRSNDVIWGWSGINQFEWSSLLEITAGMVGMRVGSLHFSTTSFHLYDHHFAKADRIRSQTLPNLEHLERSPRFDPLAVRNEETGPRNIGMEDLDSLFRRWFQVEYDIRSGSPLAHHFVETFPEPMLRSWLRIIQWWWSEGNYAHEILKPLSGTRLGAATVHSVQPPSRDKIVLMGDDRPVATIEVPEPDRGGSAFIEEAIALHNEKSAAYGDSWKRRGEMFSIIPNIARKVDRLGGGETTDETSADTAMDLMIYLAKYRTWLSDRDAAPDDANDLLREVDSQVWSSLAAEVPADYRQALEVRLKAGFEFLARLVEERQDNDGSLVDSMLVEAYRLAAYLSPSVSPLDQYRGADVD